MSNAIKIGGAKKDPASKPKVSQSIPANFFKNYQPPKTPKINPMPPPNAVPSFDPLPKISASSNTKTPSYSLTSNRHPMSMPVAAMGGLNKTPFDVKQFASKMKQNPEIKEEDETQKKEPKKDKMTPNSFTCFDVMSSPLKEFAEEAAKDNASATSASTFSDKPNKASDDEEVAPDDEEEDDGGFDMEL